MATEVKNIEGGDTGSGTSGRISVRARRTVVGADDVNQTLDPQLGLVVKPLSEFDSDPVNLANRLDDPRMYTGDTAN